MGSGRISTTVTETEREPRKTILDRLEDNRTITGEILCIKCEASNLIQEIRPFIVSEGFTDRKVIELDTLHCNLCEYQVIDDKEVDLIRNILK